MLSWRIIVENSGIEMVAFESEWLSGIVFLMTFEGGSRVAMKLVTI